MSIVTLTVSSRADRPAPRIPRSALSPEPPAIRTTSERKAISSAATEARSAQIAP